MKATPQNNSFVCSKMVKTSIVLLFYTNIYTKYKGIDFSGFIFINI